MSRRVDLGVDWFLPGRKRRFATSTVATSHLLAALADTGLTWAQMVPAINFDDEGKAIAVAFVDAGHGAEYPNLYGMTTTPGGTP